MTTKPETKFGRLITNNIDAHWTRIESFGTVGIPDLYGIRKGITTILSMVDKIIILSKIRDQWSLNYIQGIKDKNLRKKVFYTIII